MVRWCLLGLVLLGSVFVGTGGCRPPLVCLRDTNDLLLNTNETTCTVRCDCNNQRYTGRCIDRTCKVTLRESCKTKGALRACKDEFDKCQGYQICQPSHLYLQLWGDCRCDIDPENPSGEKNKPDASPDGTEPNMGGDKQLVEPGETPPERQEPPPERGPEVRPEVRPDVCPQEACGDGIDNDCDGQIDEGCTPCAPSKQLWSLTKAGMAVQHPWRPQLFSVFGNDAQAWDLQTGKSRQVLSGHTKPIRAIAVGAAGRQFATASDDGSVRIWDGQSLQLRQQIKPYEQAGTARPVVGVALHPQGKGFATIGAGTDGLVLWDASGKRIAALSQQGKTLRKRLLVKYSPDGTKIAVLGEEDGGSGGKGVVLLWDLQTPGGKYAGALTGLVGGRAAMTFHPGGQILVTSSPTETQLWDLRTMKVAQALPGAAHAIAWSPDSRRLALAHDKDIAIWHPQQQALLTRLPTQSPATSLSFSGDGAQLSGTSGLPANPTTLVWSCPCPQATTTGACYRGAPGTTNVGVCRAGTWRCDGDRRMPCARMQPPTPEIPDGLDNNCDGTKDETLVDLAIATLTITPTKAPATNSRTIRVCLHNIGHFASHSDPVIAQLYLSKDAKITNADTPLTGTTQQPNLRWSGLQGGQPPSCQTRKLTLNQTTPGPYFLGVIIDPQAQISESDESNNTKSIAIEVE